MTACIHIQPFLQHTMLADTVATQRGADLATLILPGSLATKKHDFNIDATTIHRKLHFLNHRIAIAAAGEAGHIIPLLHDARAQIDKIDAMANPLEKLSEMIYDRRGVVNALVALGGNPRGWLHYEPATDIPPYGQCAAVGSGGRDVLALTKNLGEYFSHSGRPMNNHYEVSADLMASIISSMIGNDLLFGRPRDWGGFAEWGYYSPDQSRWLYSDSSLYGFILGIPLPGNRLTLEISQYFYVYSNGDDGKQPAVLAIRFDQNSCYSKQWNINDALADKGQSARSFEDWAGQDQREKTFQIFPYGAVEKGALFKPMMLREISKARLDINKCGVRFDLDPSILDRWGAEAASAWGRTYVPLPELSDDEMQVAFSAACHGGWSAP